MSARQGLCVLGLVCLGPQAASVAQETARLRSPEPRADGRVTFRVRAPNAREVMLDLEGAKPQPMQRDAGGVWTLTTGPLEPDLYGYKFVADGARFLDPANPVVVPNLLDKSSQLHVPGPASLPWEAGDVPRGTVHRHFYRSAVVGDHRELYVYTPPGYDAGAPKPYPVLYLLHGFSDDPSAWTAVGRAHVILDNLIARGQARPMLVVMPLGYGAPEIVEGGFGALQDPRLRQRNMDGFRETLLTDVIPLVESAYRASQDRGSRAIAGLSMGGGEALTVGLNALDRFAWIGAFSSFLGPDFEATFPGLDARVNDRVRLLWIACGRDDALMDSNRKLQAWLDARKVRHARVETDGAHTWMVWRRNLAAFARLLFPSS
jgi:enterochelin esterase family protein